MNEMPKIKIAMMSYSVDGRPNKGTALYARKLIENLLDDGSLKIYLVHFKKSEDPLYKKAEEIIMPNLNLPFGNQFVSQMMFFWKFRKDKFDIIHWFQPRVYPFYWFAPAKKIVVTAHAAGEYTAASSKRFFSNEVFKFVLTYLNRWIDVCFAVSKYGKLEIEKYYKINPKKVYVTYNGGGEEFKPINKGESITKIEKKYKIKAPFILDVSRLQQHKNVGSLIKAYELLRKNNKDILEKLVIVGSASLDFEEVYGLAEKSVYKKDIFFVDFVERKDLNYFYSAAELFVFPSLNEGFGLPVVEAMASGAPVITSNITALPEVAGDAALLVDPLNIEQMSEAINNVLSDSRLKNDLKEKGLKQAKKFNWRDTAKKTKEIYLNILGYEK